MAMIWLFSAVGLAHAQTAIFRGFVSDASDGRALTGVNVLLTASDGALLGNATDGDGYFAVVRIRLEYPTSATRPSATRFT